MGGAAGESSAGSAEKPARCVLPSGSLRRRVPLRARLAKKVRTPPPPRKVQAPQKRETRRAAGVPTRSPWVYVAAGVAAAIVVAAIVIGVIVAGGGNGSSGPSPQQIATYNSLPGVRRTKAPWPPEYAELADRLLPLGLTTLGGHNGLVMHYHAHLDIFVDGKHVPVPRYVGINIGAGYLTELHTHDTRGVIHIEGQKKATYTLGQFIAEWAVFLNSRCIGSYCDGLKWYVDGKQQTGNPQALVLKPHQEIAIVVGKPPAKIPSSYKFLEGE
jgi:hypothetical protein